MRSAIFSADPCASRCSSARESRRERRIKGGLKPALLLALWSGQQRLDHMGRLDAGEPLLEPLVAETESLVVEAEEL